MPQSERKPQNERENPRADIVRSVSACLCGMEDSASGGDGDMFVFLMKKAASLGWTPMAHPSANPCKPFLMAASLGPVVLSSMADLFPYFFGSVSHEETSVLVSKVLMAAKPIPGTLSAIARETGWTPSSRTVQAAAFHGEDTLAEALSIPGGRQALPGALMSCAEAFLGTSPTANPNTPEERSQIPSWLVRMMAAYAGTSPALEAKVLSICLGGRPGDSVVPLLEAMSPEGILAAAKEPPPFRTPSAKDPDTAEALARTLLDRHTPSCAMETSCRLADHRAVTALVRHGNFRTSDMMVSSEPARGLLVPFFKPKGFIPPVQGGSETCHLSVFAHDPFLCALSGLASGVARMEDLAPFAVVCESMGLSDTGAALCVFERILDLSGKRNGIMDQISRIRAMTEAASMSSCVFSASEAGVGVCSSV